MLKKYENQKENYDKSPSALAQEKVQEFRNHFFRNISNQIPKPNQVEQNIQQKKQKRTYSAIRPQKHQEQTIIEDFPKRDHKMRRQFDARVGNIQKISSKIQDLLQYVKKNKPTQKSMVKEQDSIQVMRARQIAKIKNNLQEKQTKIKQNVNQQRYYAYKNTDNYSETNHKRQDYYDYRDKKKYANNNEDGRFKYNYADNLNKTEDKIIANDKKDIDTVKNPLEMVDKRRRSRQFLNKEDHFIYKKQTQLKRSMKVTPDKEQRLHGKIKISPTVKKQVQKTRNEAATLIDSEILKIKQRIQQSENERKKLQQKYAEYSNKTKKKNQNIIASSHLIPSSKYDQNLECSKQISKQIFKTPSQKKSTVSQFQLKIYQCQSNFEKKQTTILAQTLSNQVMLDQKLREARQKFATIRNSQKWQALKKQLQRNNININNLKELQQQLIISSDQHNPFSNDIDSSNIDSIEEIASAYINSFNHWNYKLTGCVSEKGIEKENFCVRDLDLQKKGYLSIQDFVCFINLVSGNFFRNRDMMMTYKRFLKIQGNKQINGVQYRTFLEKFTS